MAADLNCPVCNQNLPSLTALNEHLDSAHPISEETLPPKINDRTRTFVSMRKRHLDSMTMIRTRLELRLVKLLIGLQRFTSNDQSYSANGGAFWNWQESRAVKQFEQQITVWEDESVFERCRFCGQKFSLFLRKHHCRVCGLVTCGDPERECSLEVPAYLLAKKLEDLQDNFPELKQVTSIYPVRICTECRSSLLSHRNYLSDKSPAKLPIYLRLHFQLQKLQETVEQILPQFEEHLALLASRDVVPQEISEARKARQSLLRHFSKYEQIMRKLKDIEVETDSETRLKQHILAKAARFLETTMIPLQSLPQAMRYDKVGGGPRIDKYTASTLQSQLVVLQEQKFLLEQQVETAKRKRHFDALAPLELSLAEISSEADKLTEKLGQLAPSA